MNVLIRWTLALLLTAPAWAGEPESLKDRPALDLGSAAAPRPPAPPAGTSLAPAPAGKSLRGLRVTFISVGQGDSEYIELPDGENALVDGGPDAATLAAFLQGQGVTRINHVVLTHPHADHYTGLNYVFDRLQVDNFYDTRMDNASATGDEAVRAKAAKEPGCVTHYPRPGETLDWGQGVSVKVFNSCPDPVKSNPADKESSSPVNDCSIVLKAQAEGLSVLLQGDASAAVEAAMTAAFGTELKADVLKVGHHGSAYSSSDAYLREVRPRWAVIEVGPNNYGHPTKSALARLQAAGARIYRTDQDGTVSTSDMMRQMLVSRLGGTDPLATLIAQ